MKKLLCIALSAVFAMGTLVSCQATTPKFSPKISVTSSEAEEYATWLTNRLGTVSDNLVLGTGDSAGIDMTEFENDGFILRKNGNDAIIVGKTAQGIDRGVRYYANHCTDVDAAEHSYGEGYRVKKITVADRDISEYSIYLFPDADECHTYAAAELQKYIKLACGAELPIVREPVSHMIALERVLEDDVRYTELGDEGFTISVNEDGNISIIGGRWRGCLYGTFELLEMIGWRFFGKNELCSPGSVPEEEYYYLYESELVNIEKGFSATQIPSFELRPMYYSQLPNYLSKQKENGSLRDSPKYNGYGMGIYACHGMQNQVIPYFEDYEFKGYGSENPCFTREDYIEIAEEVLSRQIDSRLASGHRIGMEICDIDVSQCDSEKFCTCNECLKYVKKDGSNTGPVMYFTNRMAEYFGEKYPGIYVSMLSYLGTTKPPKVTVPLPNVNVSYCYYNDVHKHACMSHGADGKDCSPLNTDSFGYTLSNCEYANEFEAWCRIAQRVTVWYYPGVWEGEIFSSSTLKNLRKDYKYFSDNGVYGVFACTAYPNDVSMIGSDKLIAPLLLSLMWNADMSEEEYWGLIEEYYRIVYGEGYDSIADYQRWLITSAKAGCWTVMGWSYPTDRIDFEKVRCDFEYCIALIDRALSLAESTDQYSAVELYSRPVLYTGLCAVYDSWYINGTAEQKARYEELYNRFKALALKTRLQMWQGAPVLTEGDFDISSNPVTLSKGMYENKTDWWDKIS